MKKKIIIGSIIVVVLAIILSVVFILIPYINNKKALQEELDNLDYKNYDMLVNVNRIETNELDYTDFFSQQMNISTYSDDLKVFKVETKSYINSEGETYNFEEFKSRITLDDIINIYNERKSLSIYLWFNDKNEIEKIVYQIGTSYND